MSAEAKQNVNPDLLEWLKPVQDPEMFLSIVDLGLVYETALEDEGKKAVVKMTLTSPHCPVADMFVDNVRKRCLEYPGVAIADVTLVFEPKWDPATMASDEVKDRLGIW
jgi:metal-sulfur cluster biosynthetic enzyme